MRAELMTIVVSQVDIWAHLGSSFELVNVCQGWEQSVLNRISCVNVAQTPGWQHLDYFRVVTIRPEQRQENVRKPADLICRP